MALILTPLPNGRGFAAATVIGPLELRPSHKHWRKRLSWWRCWHPGRLRWLGPYTFTPRLALAAALHDAAPKPINGETSVLKSL